MQSSTPPTEMPYRWYLLTLGTLTNALVTAAPAMAMPVLFDEISAELNLSLIQVGVIWGISALPAILSGLLAGAAGDRFGPKRVIILSCVLIGLAGAARGLSNGFLSLALTMLLFGMFQPFIPLNSFKTCGQWFSNRQIGMASGVLSMGMALGFLAGSMFSATILSPLLGGWRGVLALYGAAALLLAIPWALTRTPPDESPVGELPKAISMRRSLIAMAHIRSIWFFGLALFGFSGAVQGALGYLPLYLRGQGWAPAAADGALAGFHTISMIFVIPIALASDRLGTRRGILLAAAIITAVGFGLLAVAQGPLVWAAVLLAGMVRDGFMAVIMTAILEIKGVGPSYAGSAIGIVMLVSGVGNLLAPPLGNSLASINPGLPFLFWSLLALLGLGGLILAWSRRRAALAPAGSIPPL